MELEWTKGYTGGLAYAWQADWECSIEGAYRYAIMENKTESIETHPTLVGLQRTVTHTKYDVYYVKRSTYVDNAIWDYDGENFTEDGSEIGYALYHIKEVNQLENAKLIALQHYIDDLKSQIVERIGWRGYAVIDKNTGELLDDDIEIVVNENGELKSLQLIKKVKNE